MSEAKKKIALSGVVAGETAICTVGKEGVGLTYRGYTIEDLAAHATYEEVAWLVLDGELPTHAQLDGFREKLIALRALPPVLRHALELLPAETHPMDVLRTGCSVLGTIEPEGASRDGRAVALRLLAAFPAMLLYWHHFTRSGRRIETATNEPGVASHFLHLLHGRSPSLEHARAMDVSLILYTEHEFNASTFASRVVAGTGSDFYSCVCAGIGALRGPLHGGANEAAMAVIEKYRTPDEAEAGMMDALATKQVVMGFGHPVYRICDPRSDIVKSWSKTLSAGHPEEQMYAVSERIETVMKREKNLFPNLDFFSASAFHFLGVPTPMFTPIFVFARIAGWAAHILEQRVNRRLIRPTAEYTGPSPRAFVPIERRG
ncbi:MAG: 2-methylcitrate synthase [Chthoniobacteraceae bacterium]